MLIGADAKQYGKLKLLDFSHMNRHRKKVMRCLCECGKEHLALLSELKSGHTTSCGCYKPNLVHGMYKTRFYQCWADMKTRCLNPKHKQWKDYGGRGITVDSAWLEFSNFYKDMFPTYQDHLTIERIDVNGNYCATNCTWATRADQNRNTRRVLAARGGKSYASFV